MATINITSSFYQMQTLKFCFEFFFSENYSITLCDNQEIYKFDFVKQRINSVVNCRKMPINVERLC